jgi:L-ascorbate metabolism protein UlaG (beta-lactamase superfamily)
MEVEEMKIQWMGHASFLIETNGVKILTDPFDESIGYRPNFPEVDIVLVSHEHFDHNAVGEVPSYKELVKGYVEKEIKGIQIKGIKGYHDNAHGKLRGEITIFKILSEGISTVHLSDIGTTLTKEQLEEIGKTDIVMIPVGGVYTVGPREAWNIIGQLKPKIVLPMHYKTPFLKFNLHPVYDFLKEKKYVEKDKLEVNANSLSEKMGVVVLTFPE